MRFKMIPVSEELLRALEDVKMPTEAELWEQRVSFAYGNLSLHNPKITRQDVERAATELYGPKPKADMATKP